MSTDRIAFALSAAMLAGCGSSEPSRPLSGLSLEVQSAEWEAGRNLVVVGENASAQVAALTDEGCLSSTPCSTSAEVEINSSNPDVRVHRSTGTRSLASIAWPPTSCPP